MRREVNYRANPRFHHLRRSEPSERHHRSVRVHKSFVLGSLW